MLTRTPSLYGAHAGVPYNNIADLVKAAKKAPGTILTGGTLGSTSHFVWLLLEDATGIKLKHVSYDGTRQRMTALLGKHIEMGELNVVSGGKYIQTGQLKALGITTSKRNSSIPNVPTLREQGYNLIFGVDRGVSLPKGTSKAKIDFWAKAFETAANNPALVETFRKKGTDVNFMGPAQSTAYWKSTFKNWKAIATKIGMYKGG
jgi:tripartite-type tricarboxylate transporter receptor subunit TctC